MINYGIYTWTGGSGKKYEFETYSLDAEFVPGIEGNYIFAKPIGDGKIRAVYIGEGVLKDRIEFRINEGRVQPKGCDRVCVMVNPDAANRKFIEEDLLSSNTNAYAPLGCNIKVGG
ncbi:hypothetical protein [Bacteroides timonensis]|uniref:hypothetical protein n=1 Tax=Bacteroides timonensis TaxID=1470345 RepID=UPI000F7A1520|nr:hypothetical protein [Bacteroides timonensis]